MTFQAPTPKYGVLITTVDPDQNLIEGVLKTGGVARIGMYSKPPAFRWPQVGEAWMARHENGNWVLDSLWPSTNLFSEEAAADSVFKPSPGDLVLDSSTGQVRVQGSLDGTTDFTFDKDSFGIGNWIDLAWIGGGGPMGSAFAAGTYMLYPNQITAIPGTSQAAFYLDPADFVVPSGRTLQVRVRGGVITNVVSPGTVNYTFGLYPVATWDGASGADPTVASIGAATTTVVINAPGASAHSTAVSSGVAFPTAGFYVTCVTLSAQQATNCLGRAICRVQWALV